MALFWENCGNEVRDSGNVWNIKEIRASVRGIRVLVVAFPGLHTKQILVEEVFLDVPDISAVPNLVSVILSE